MNINQNVWVYIYQYFKIYKKNFAAILKIYPIYLSEVRKNTSKWNSISNIFEKLKIVPQIPNNNINISKIMDLEHACDQKGDLHMTVTTTALEVSSPSRLKAVQV